MAFAQSSAPVFERAHLRIAYSKTVITKNPDDSYSFNRKTLCSTTQEIDIKDYRALPDKYIDATYGASCVGEHDGKPVYLLMNIFALIDRRDPFDTGILTDYKSYYANFSSRHADGTPVNLPNSDGQSVFTKDLTLRNMTLEVYPKQYISCPSNPKKSITNVQTFVNSGSDTPKLPGDCQITNPVAFGAMVEFETL